MRFYYSYWPKPANNKRWHIDRQTVGNLWLFALSLVYLKLNRQEAVLYTDAEGEHLLSILPYDNIYRSLDALGGLHPEFWCAGKFVAHQQEALGNIHIDGDVFIKSEKTLSCLDMTGVDLLVQNTECCFGGTYDWGCGNIAAVYKRAGMDSPVDVSTEAYNVGIIGLNNAALKKRYLADFWNAVDLAGRDAEFLRLCAGANDTGLILVMEQKHLYGIADKADARVKPVLGWDRERIGVEAEALDYCHVIGGQKYEEPYQSYVKEQLRRLNPWVYEKTLKKEKEILEG